MDRSPLRLIVTGSRTFTNHRMVWNQLTMSFARAQIAGKGLLVVQGDCPEGPDRFAAQWTMEQMRWGAPVDVLGYPANWDKYGKAAGFRRNEQMVRDGAWGILGFLDDCRISDCTRPRPHGSHGTSHCLKVAKARGIPVRAWKTKGWQGE